MKIKLIAVLCATAALAGCSPSGERMNEPSGAERPAYESPNRSTNAPSTSVTNDTGNAGAKTNDASRSGATTTP